MKDIKYILKRIIIGVGIVLALMYIKGNFLLNANALTVNIGGNTLDSSNYLVLQTGNTQLTFTGGTVYRDINDFPQYYLLTLCTDSNRVSSWSINNQSLSSIDYYSTNFKCSFPNSTYTGGHILYVYGQVNPSQNCSVNLTNCYQGGISTFYVPNRSSWALLSYQASMDSISIDYSSSTIVSQNQDIINGQQSIINNQNQNTQSIINNQNQNTQEIIDNQNSIAEQQNENQKVCKVIDNNSIVINNRYLTSTGSANSSSNFGITDYYSLTGSSITPRVAFSTSTSSSLCFYNINKNLISCLSNNSLVVNQDIDIPSDASYVRFSIQKVNNEPQFNYCVNGNQSINDSLNDDNVDSATNKASSFFDDFSVNSHGLSGIITSPLRLINSLSTSSCSPLSLPLPFVNQSVVLPCMSTIYSQHFSTFLTLYRLITDGIISYWVLIKIFGHIKGMQSPEDDRIEVLDL